MRVNHNCVDCRLLPPSGGFQIHTFMLFGTCSLLSFPPSPLSSPSSLSRLEVYHLCKKNSSFRLTPGGTVIRMSAVADAVDGRTSLRVAPRRFARSLARWAFLKLHRFTQRSLHDSRGVTVDLHYGHSLIFVLNDS